MHEKLTAANGKNDTTSRDAWERQCARTAVRIFREYRTSARRAACV